MAISSYTFMRMPEQTSAGTLIPRDIHFRIEGVDPINRWATALSSADL